MSKRILIDPEMDNTQDMDNIKGSKGIYYLFTNLSDLQKDFFRKYVTGKSFFDIGCGDGRIILKAMMCGAKKYSGVEIDGEFIKSSNMKRYIKKGNYKEINPNNYEVIYYFLGSTEKIPLDGEGELEFINYIKNFEGTLILYYRKVVHRLEKFQENLFKEGFKEIDNAEYLRVYRRSE